MKIMKLRTNHMKNPVGFLPEPLMLSWKVEDAQGTKTEKIRVEMSKDPDFASLVYDSGERSGVTGAGFVPDMKLEEKEKYFWRVTVWDETGDHAVSQPAFFELPGQGIEGEWIQAPYEKEAHSLFARPFQKPQGEIRQARLYITALGVYECYLNGKKVGEEYLAPFYNDYNHWLQFQTYDVTEMLEAGENVLGVMLGNGWYKGRFGFIEHLDRLYGDTQELLCALEITMADGTVFQVHSDESFLCCKSPILESSIYDGEVYDAGKEIKDWAKPGCERSAWVPAVLSGIPQGKLTPRKSLPLVLKEERRPVAVLHTPAGETVLDFGQNLTGLFRFTCREPADTRIRLWFGEILQENNFYNENLRSAKEEYTYISNGETSIVRPYFTFYGYRYMKVEGVEDIEAADFTALVLYSDMEQTGFINTSNEKVNQLIRNTLWGQKGNFVDTPTDCPQRDERMGWTGDAQVFCATACYNMHTPVFYHKFLYDMLLEQRTLGGAVPHVVPDVLDQINSIMTDPVRVKELGLSVSREEDSMEEPQMATGSCAWGDAACVIPWTTYLFYGDKAMLEKQYENMKLWVDYIHEIDETKCGGKRLWTYGFHFADWLSLDSLHPETCLGGTDSYYVASAYYLYSATLASKAAQVLGKTEEAAYYRQLAGEVRAAMRAEYFTGTGRLAVDTQTALVLALYFDIAPEEHRGRLAERLKQKLDEEKVHLTTGFVGTPYLCPALTENGLCDYAYTLLLNEDFPSWLYEVNMGATTIWERWNSVLPDGSISDTGMNSLNHYAYGSIVEWIYKYMCGLRPAEDAPGFKEFVIKPYVDERFHSVSLNYDSTYGMIESTWAYEKEEDGKTLALTIRVPFDTRGRFEISHTVGNILGKRSEKELCVSVDGKSRSLDEKAGIWLEPGIYRIMIQ